MLCSKTTGVVILLLSSFLISCVNQMESSIQTKSENLDGVIYNGDSRVESSNLKKSKIDRSMQTAILIDNSKIAASSKQFSVRSRPLGELYPLCPDARFQDQPAVGFCTAVLVSPKLLLTAGHCFRTLPDCSEVSAIFDWSLEKSKKEILPISEKFQCKRILTQRTDSIKGLDYALIELDRPVDKADPVQIADSTDFAEGELFFSFSYPQGIPLKVDKAVLLKNESFENTMKFAVDTFEGSSGSPLFNSYGELVGILSSGMEDFREDDIREYQQHGGCVKMNKCATGTCFGETYVKAPKIKEMIQSYIKDSEAE